MPNPAAAAANRSGWLVLLTPVRNLPSPVMTSSDSTVSATEPSAAEVDSIPPPEKAPPAVIPGNSGTTAGTSPRASAAAASSSWGAPGSTWSSLFSRSTAITPASLETSTAAAFFLYKGARVRLESATPPADLRRATLSPALRVSRKRA